MRLFEISNQPTLYRAQTSRTRYPNGEFWSEIRNVAEKYQQKGQKPRELVRSYQFPKKPFNVSASFTGARLDKLQKAFLAFMRHHYPDVDIKEEPYMYEVLFNGETDFPYPKIYDVEFLKRLGYDSVYFEIEGGETVKTWFVFDPLPRETINHAYGEPDLI